MLKAFLRRASQMGKLGADDPKKLLSCTRKDSRVPVPPMVGYDSGVHLARAHRIAQERERVFPQNADDPYARTLSGEA